MSEKVDETKMADEAEVPHRPRTVADYESAAALTSALMEPNLHPSSYQKMTSCGGGAGGDGNGNIISSICCDWQTPLLDCNTSAPESLEKEVERLMVLKEYQILDSDREEKFERITALASRIFDIPICLVSLVDIGRQWFMSAT